MIRHAYYAYYDAIILLCIVITLRFAAADAAAAIELPCCYALPADAMLFSLYAF